MLLASTNEVYDTVIIDEAGQAVEPSTLIPLKYSNQLVNNRMQKTDHDW